MHEKVVELYLKNNIQEAFFPVQAGLISRYLHTSLSQFTLTLVSLGCYTYLDMHFTTVLLTKLFFKLLFEWRVRISSSLRVVDTSL